MSIIRNSPRALLIALLPLALWQAAIFASGLAGYVTSGVPLPTPDRAFGIFLLRCGIDAVLLWLGHLLLRRLGSGARAAYAITGGVAMAVGYAVAFWAGIWIATPDAGTVVTGAIFPVLVGMIAGFLYAQFAGREFRALARIPRTAAPPLSPATYDGPVQVRTSIAAIAIASAIPALSVTVLALPILLIGLEGFASDGPQSGPGSIRAAQFAIPAQMFLGALFAMAVPSAVVVGATHALARGFRRTNGRDYAAIGAVLACVGALLLAALVHWGVLFPLAAMVGALMGAVYRRFAGLEPLPLPEEVLAGDPRHMVAEDHPSRRTHAVVIDG